MPIKLELSDIKGRQQAIASILYPLTHNQPIRIEQPRNIADDTYVFAVRDPNFSTQQKFTDWRVNTKFDSIKIQYYELWQEDEDSRGDFYLIKKYLHIFRAMREAGEDKEFLAIHSDPNENEEECFDYQHKVGPHIHIKPAGFPISKFHLSIFLDTFTEVNSSLENLDRAFRLATSMIEDQIHRFTGDDWIIPSHIE